MSGSLYIVATPIGNLSDITYRALEVLKDVDLILAEDTRVTKNLLDAYTIQKDVLRYDQHSFRNEAKRLEILNVLLQGNTIALVTDAGTPGISDPGNELIDWLYEVEANVQIVPIPGASSVSTALSVCGFDASSYLFLGFLPKKKREAVFQKVKNASVSCVFFESPYRISKTLLDLQATFGGEKRICVCRELTKMHEEILRGTISETLLQLQAKPSIKGEIVVVVEM